MLTNGMMSGHCDSFGFLRKEELEEILAEVGEKISRREEEDEKRGEKLEMKTMRGMWRTGGQSG